LDDQPAGRVRLLCFAPVVAAEARFAGWRTQLPHGVELWAFDPIGQGKGGIAPANLAGIAAAAAAEVATLPILPILAFGHREGALHAFETARALQAGHKIVPERLILSGWPAPDVETVQGRPDPASDEALIERLRASGAPSEVLEHEELMAAVLARLRHALALIEEHRAETLPPLRCPATLIYGESDELAAKDDVLRWRGWLGPADALAVAAGGDFLVEREREIVAAIGAVATEVLRRAG
jgi:surfactin synthase thioesterase subunit